MNDVYQRVARSVEAVRTSLTGLHDPSSGPVTRWSQEQLRTWSNRPFNNTGEQRPLMHHASAGVQAEFGDFAELSRWIAHHANTTDGFRVARIDWALTDDRKQELLAEARRQAVHDALTRARHYAEALGLGDVRPVAVADAGLLVAGQTGAGAAQAPQVRAAASAAVIEVEFTPKEIEVKASVDARFHAEGT